MKKIKNYMLPEHFNKIYKVEASSTMALAREVTEKLNELIDQFNSLNEGDVLWKQDQEGRIRKGILYMKDNLINTLDSMMEQLKESGFIDDRIKDNLNHLDERLNNLIGSVVEGSTTLDAEIIDGRIGEDGTKYSNLGQGIRTQIHYINPLIYLYLGVDFNTDTGEIKLNTNSQGKISYTDIKRKTSAVSVATSSGESVFCDMTNSRPVVIAINITEGVASLKATTINTYIPANNDIILFYVYLGTVVPVSIVQECLIVDGSPFMERSSKYKKYNGSVVGLDCKLRIDELNLKATLDVGYYVLPFYKTRLLYLDNEVSVSFSVTGSLEYILFDPQEKTLSVVDRFHRFTPDEFCLGTLYRGTFTPVEIMSESVSYTNNDRDVIGKNTFTTINDMFKTLSDPNKKTKIVLAGDSITHGTGGTGFAENGSLIINDGSKSYYRNTNGYCWAKLFKEYIETNFNAEVINNGCTGTHSNWWNSYKGNLIPSDTDIVILTIGTNDRNNSTTSGTTKAQVITNFYNNLTDIVKWCHERGIQIVLCSPIPATATSESNSMRLASVFEMNEVIQRVASDFNMEYANIYNEVFYHIVDKNIDINSMLPDGLHPNDAMYKIMFYQYLKAFNLAPHYNIVN